MKRRLLQTAIALGAFFATASCAPVAEPTPRTEDMIATAAMKEAYVMQTLTALAASPTPTITFTPAPTPTETLTPEPTAPLKRPLITAPTGCWTGPGPKYKLISNLPARKYVELLGIGSVPGWYVIVNPYFHKPCWIEAIYLKLDPRVDTSVYPTVMPLNP